MDGSLADILGHHKRLNLVLYDQSGARLLQVGLRMAIAQYRGGKQNALVRYAQSPRIEFWSAVHMGGDQRAVFLPCRSFLQV